MEKVFEESWIKQLKLRYNKSGISAPPVYRVATLDEWRDIRDEIENWFVQLSEFSQKKLLLNLRNPNSFLQTYNELAVAGSFLELNYDLEYESNIEGLTPDWIIKKDNETLFIVEVFSRVVPEKIGKRQTQISELWTRLKEIPIGVALFISYENLSEIPQLDSKITKNIANRVRIWLNEETPEPKTTKVFNGMVFKVLSYNSKWSHVILAGPSSGGFTVNNQPIYEGIEEKVKKYKNLLDELNLPLVVAVVPSFDTALGADDIEEVLFDRELFDKRPILSAVIGLWRNSMCNYQIAIYHNPKAVYPISEKMLKI